VGNRLTRWRWVWRNDQQNYKSRAARAEERLAHAESVPSALDPQRAKCNYHPLRQSRGRLRCSTPASCLFRGVRIRLQPLTSAESTSRKSEGCSTTPSLILNIRRRPYGGTRLAGTRSSLDCLTHGLFHGYCGRAGVDQRQT
jgi:hypothetical protein